MRTLRPGQQCHITVERMGSDWWLIVRVAGSSYRSSVSREDLKRLAFYVLDQIGYGAPDPERDAALRRKADG